MCEQLAQSRYLPVHRARVEPTTSRLSVLYATVTSLSQTKAIAWQPAKSVQPSIRHSIFITLLTSKSYRYRYGFSGLWRNRRTRSHIIIEVGGVGRKGEGAETTTKRNEKQQLSVNKHSSIQTDITMGPAFRLWLNRLPSLSININYLRLGRRVCVFWLVRDNGAASTWNNYASSSVTPPLLRRCN